MDTIIDFTPDRTGREYVVTYTNGETYVYPQVGWLTIADVDGGRYVEPAVYNGDIDRVETVLSLLAGLSASGRRSDWRGDFT